VSLPPGSRLGAYEVTAQIGVGGMGEVYRATDSGLKRQVAIKVLPASVAGDADRLARFQREAEVLAALNHPNIAAIYGLEKTADFTALVMELVEGEDLSQRIARGAMPLDEALPIAKQIAEALQAAHEQGIIHRDLKPANVKVRSDGTVKVLDFGLAKALDQGSGIRDQGSGGVANSPTITTPAMTMQGMILGTAAYMSPEQARGKTVDKRADIWAFGAVLFEMLAGARPFEGEDTTEVIAAVVKTTPNWSALPADVPRPIVTLIQRCLEKDRKARVGDIAAAQFLLTDYSTLGASDTTPTRPAPAPRSAVARALPWAVAAVFAVAAGALLMVWAPWRGETPVDRPLVRLDVDLGADVSLPPPNNGGSSVIISPDATRLVYASGTPPKLFIRRLDEPKAVELPGTDGATSPFFSPDGRWVGFHSGRGAYKISVEGGAVVPLGDTAALRGASWDADGSIVAAVAGELLRISTDGVSQSVARTGDGELVLSQPQILPGGMAILFTVDNPGDVDKTTIQVMTLADRQKKTVIRGGASARYLATSSGAGHLVYVNKATLFAVPFDLRTLETRGAAVPIVDDVAAEGLVGIGQFDVSHTGTLIYRRTRGSTSGLSIMKWVAPSGTTETLSLEPAIFLYPRLSPDGKRIALTVIGRQGMDVWTYDPQRDTMTRLTFGDNNNRPLWSPDGRYVLFSSASGGIHQVRADGASQPRALTPSKALQYPGAFTPDGKRLAYAEVIVSGQTQIWTVPLEDQGGQLTAGTPEPFLTSRFNDTAPAFSPDGRWLAYQSNESGTNEVYVRAFPSPATDQGRRWQISNDGGAEPRWSRTGRELMYRAGDQIMAAGYTVSGEAFVPDKPRGWIAHLDDAAGSLVWDLAPDGTGVAVVTRIESSKVLEPERVVVFLQNFFDELRRRVPLDK
jgi:serine/threonine-protein kinase